MARSWTRAFMACVNSVGSRRISLEPNLWTLDEISLESN